MVSKVWRSVLVCASLAAVLGASGAAWAQDSSSDDSKFNLGQEGTRLACTSTTTVLGTVTEGVYLTLRGFGPGVRIALQQYVLRNEQAVMAGATLGAGAAVEDLAELFAVPTAQRARFGAALRARRAQVVALLPSAGQDAGALDGLLAVMVASTREAAR